MVDTVVRPTQCACDECDALGASVGLVLMSKAMITGVLANLLLTPHAPTWSLPLVP